MIEGAGSVSLTNGSGIGRPKPKTYGSTVSRSATLSFIKKKTLGSGSGSFYDRAKIIRKILIPTVLRLLCDFLSLKNDVNVASKSKKKLENKKFFSCHLEGH
jgi:hypothetical protein